MASTTPPTPPPPPPPPDPNAPSGITAGNIFTPADMAALRIRGWRSLNENTVLTNGQVEAYRRQGYLIPRTASERRLTADELEYTRRVAHFFVPISPIPHSSSYFLNQIRNLARLLDKSVTFNIKTITDPSKNYREATYVDLISEAPIEGWGGETFGDERDSLFLEDVQLEVEGLQNYRGVLSSLLNTNSTPHPSEEENVADVNRDKINEKTNRTNDTLLLNDKYIMANADEFGGNLDNNFDWNYIDYIGEQNQRAIGQLPLSGVPHKYRQTGQRSMPERPVVTRINGNPDIIKATYRFPALYYIGEKGISTYDWTTAFVAELAPIVNGIQQGFRPVGINIHNGHFQGNAYEEGMYKPIPNWFGTVPEVEYEGTTQIICDINTDERNLYDDLDPTDEVYTLNGVKFGKNAEGRREFLNYIQQNLVTGWVFRMRSLWDDDYDRTEQAPPRRRHFSEVYLNSISEIYQNKIAYLDSAVAVTKIDGRAFTDIRVPNRTFLVKGKLVKVPNLLTNRNGDEETYNSDGKTEREKYPNGAVFWDGSFKYSWTSNPAWIAYDLITNKRYGLGVEEENVDRYSFYEWARYCDEDLIVGSLGGVRLARHTCNVVINRSENAIRVVRKVLAAGRGVLHNFSTKIKVVFDALSSYQVTDFGGDATVTFNDDDDVRINGNPLSINDASELSDDELERKYFDPTALVTNANVLEGKFNYSTTGESTLFSVARVSFLDASNDYKETFVSVTHQELFDTIGYKENNLQGFGITNRNEAYRLGKWTLESLFREREQVTYSAGFDHAFIEPYDIIWIQDNHRTAENFGGRIQTSAFSPEGKLTINGDSLTINGEDLSFGGYLSFALDREIPNGLKSFVAVNKESKLVAFDTSHIRGTQGKFLIVDTTNVRDVSSYLDGSNPNFQSGAVWIGVGNNTQPRPYRVLSITQKENSIYEISASQQSVRKYFDLDEEDEDAIERSDFIPLVSYEDFATLMNFQHTTYVRDKESVILITWDKPTSGTFDYYEYEYIAGQVDLESTRFDIDDDAERQKDTNFRSGRRTTLIPEARLWQKYNEIPYENYIFRVRMIDSANSRTSDWRYYPFLLSQATQGITTLPNVEAFNFFASGSTLILRWNAIENEENYLSLFYEIRYSSDDEARWEDAVVLTTVSEISATAAYTHEIYNRPGKYFIKARLENTLSVESETANSILVSEEQRDNTLGIVDSYDFTDMEANSQIVLQSDGRYLYNAGANQLEWFSKPIEVADNCLIDSLEGQLSQLNCVASASLATITTAQFSDTTTTTGGHNGQLGVGNYLSDWGEEECIVGIGDNKVKLNVGFSDRINGQYEYSDVDLLLNGNQFNSKQWMKFRMQLPKYEENSVEYVYLDALLIRLFMFERHEKKSINVVFDSATNSYMETLVLPRLCYPLYADFSVLNHPNLFVRQTLSQSDTTTSYDLVITDSFGNLINSSMGDLKIQYDVYGFGNNVKN